MKKLYIKLDFLNGPIWCEKIDIKTMEKTTGIEIIDKDLELKRINNEIQEMFSSYYEFNSHEQSCFFNEEKQKKDKDKMLDLFMQLDKRIKEINDGSFIVIDEETERINAL